MSRFTNFPNGITSLGIPTFGVGALPPYTGNYFFVEESTTPGVLAGQGTAQQPYNTLQQALAQCKSGNNDVVFLTGTVHLAAPLVWNLNNTHLIGVDAPLVRGKRARISSYGTTAYGPMVTVSGNGCQMSNFGSFFGFSVTGASTPIAWLDTGGRNCYDRVEFMGFGDATVTTGTANETTARALKISNNVGESTFRSCVFGVDTVQRGATNYTVEIASGAPRISFIDCDFEADLAAGGSASSHLLIGDAGIDRYLKLQGCRFLNSTLSGGTAMAQAFNVSAAAGGVVLMDQCTAFGITAWETAASGSVFTNMGAVSAPGGGISLVL